MPQMVLSHATRFERSGATWVCSSRAVELWRSSRANVFDGDWVLIYSAAARRTPAIRKSDFEMFARIGTFAVAPENIDAVVEHFRTEAVRAFSRHRGFLGYQSFVDRKLGRMVGISRWTSRAELEASGESARNILARANELGASVVGEPQILEEAFDAAPVA